MVHFDPYSIEFHNDPYPVYKELRDKHPVYFHEGLNFYAIARYEDVVEAHRDNETFSSAGGKEGTWAPLTGLTYYRADLLCRSTQCRHDRQNPVVSGR